MPVLSPIQALEWRRPLQPRETAQGFASRLAALNGIDLQTLLRDMRIPHRAIDHGMDDALDDLATLGGLDRNGVIALAHYTPRRLADERASTVNGERLPYQAVHRTFFRYCPHCVAADLREFDGPKASRPWLRLEWVIEHVRSCRVHDMALVEAKPIRRRFQAFDFNETIGHLLPTLVAVKRQAVHVPHSGFEDWVVARIDGIRDPGNWLDDVPLHAAIPFCEGLGLSILREPKVKTAEFGQAEWGAAGAEGFRIASAGADAVLNLLGRLMDEQAGTRGVIGPRDTYGYVYGVLQRSVADPAFAKFRDLVRTHAFENMPLEAGTDVLGERLTERRVHTVRTASVASGTHTATIRRMFARRGVEGAEGGSTLRNHRVAVAADEVSQTLSKFEGAMTSPAAMKATGIPRLHFRAIVAEGFLPTLMDTNAEAYAKHRFARADVDALMAKLFEGSVPVPDPTPRQMSLIDARAVATASLPDLIGFVFKGKLEWKGRTGPPDRYGNLLVDADEVTRLVRAGPTRVNLTNAEAAEFLTGIGPPTVPLLIRAGLLTTVQEFSPDARRMITVVSRESAEAFKARYITLGEICRVGGLHHTQATPLLAKAGVREAFPFKEMRTYIYERDEVTVV